MTIQFRMQHLTPDGKGELFLFDRLPSEFTYRHSNRLAEEVGPGQVDPIIQLVGGAGTEYTISVRLLDVVDERDKTKVTAGAKAAKWRRINEKKDKQGNWMIPPVFMISGFADDVLFTGGGDLVVVDSYAFTFNPNHLMNLGDRTKTRVGDITLNMTLKRAATFVANKPIGPAIR